MDDVLKDLVNSKAIADRLGVQPSAVLMWRRRDLGFPDPLDTPGVSGVPLFSWRAVAAWHKARVEAGVHTDQAKRERMAYARQFRH